MHAIRAFIGATALTLATVSSLAAAEQQKVEVVLQLAGSTSAVQDQPYGAPITTIALSGDGKRALAGDLSGTVSLWNVSDGSLLRTFRHPAAVSAVAFADGPRIVTVAKGIRVWDAETGRLIQAVETSLPDVVPFAISRDGSRMVSAGGDNMSEWDVTTGRVLRTYYSPNMGPAGALATATYSADGRYLLTVHQDPKVRMWDTGTGDLVREFEVVDFAPTAVTMSPDASRVLALANGKAKVWDAKTGKLIKDVPFDNSALASVSILAQGNRLLVSDGKDFSVIDAAAGKVVRSTELHTERVVATAFARDGKQILLATEVGTLRLADSETGKAVRDFSTPYAATILSAAFSPDGKQVFVGENSKRIQQWDLGAGRLARTLDATEERIRWLDIARDGTRLLSGNASTFDLWDLSTGRVTRTFATGDKQVMPPALSPDGRHVLANGLKENEISVWDAVTGTRLRNLQGDFSFVLRGVFSPDSKSVATIGFNTPIQLWDVATGKLARTFDGSVRVSPPLAFSADGRRIVVSGPGDSAASIWDTVSGKRLGASPALGESYYFSPDGQRLLATSVEQISLSDVANGRLLMGLPSQIPFEIPALFLDDSKSFLVGGYERMLTQRDVSTGGVIREFVGHTGPIIALAISPDGRRALTGGPDTTAKLWDIASGALLATFVVGTANEWVVLTPEGFFSASPKGGDYLRVVSGFEALPSGRFQQLLHRPDLVADKIAGDPRGVVREAAARLDLPTAFAAARQTR